MPSEQQFVEAGWQVAPRFGLEATDVELLSQSENVVLALRLSDDRAAGRRVVMRFHRPGYNRLDELESEVAWVEGLRTAGIAVPRARAVAAGQHYLAAEVGGIAHQVGVVEWVDGQPLADLAENAGVVAHYRRIGEVAARIRQASSHWQPPAGFRRRSWDADGLMGDEPLWGRFWEADQLTEAQGELFERARRKLHAELAALPMGPDHYGLIHADLHLGNLMAHGDELTVIDFDDAGYGWHAYELAVALHPTLGEPWFDDARQELVAGYSSVAPIDEADIGPVDTFLLVRSLLLVGWLAARPELAQHRLLRRRASAAEEHIARYEDLSSGW